MELIKQRLKSKTYWLALFVILIQTVDQFHGQIISTFFGGKVALGLQVLWPVLFMAVREFTTKPLAEK